MFTLVGTVGSLFLSSMRDLMAMGRYFATGRYVANTAVQAELFGPVPTVEDAARRMLGELGLPTKAG
jgi:hypothetical protein